MFVEFARNAATYAWGSGRNHAGSRPRGRRLRLESLENRELLAADLAVTELSSDGQNFVLKYSVNNENASAFTVGLYTSEDGVTAGTQLQFERITDSADYAQGRHSLTIERDFSVSTDDYYIVAFIDVFDDVNESNETNNNGAFEGGAFLTDDGVVQVGGDDTFVVDGGDDSFYGGNGDDVMLGRPGDNDLFGEDGYGDGSIYGDDGVDMIHGDGGKDLIFGGDDSDVLDGGDAADAIFASDGDDPVYATTADSGSLRAGNATQYASEAGNGYGGAYGGIPSVDSLSLSLVAGMWTITGSVSDPDEDLSGMTVTIGGGLVDETVTVGFDETFGIAVDAPEQQVGWLTATVTDSDGNVSETFWYRVL